MFRGLVILWGVSTASAFVSPIPSLGSFPTKIIHGKNSPVPTLSGDCKIQKHPSSTSTTLYENKLWDRLEIEEDPEPFWYLLNCVAGLEIDLLRQCREVCEDMPDALKFVVPTEKKTRSHGANRMVTETKVKYQGYVFAKLRLCPEVYEAIQNLDLCRSWMGTVNRKGYRKLPPSPQALNGLEIENFGLEEEEFEEAQEDEDEDVIVDSAENDAKKSKWEVDEEDLKVYLGLKVEDMVKVTKKNKFFGEDGIVRRLKDGKIMIRFFTYGSQFDEWLDPGDVRVLTSTEILKGLGGPSQPITQQDFDGPEEGGRGGGRGGGDREWSPRNQPGNMRNNLMSNVKGARGPRNRRMDRNDRGDRFKRDFFGRTDREREQEEKNWKWYQENQRKKKGDGPEQGSAGDWNNEWEFKGGSKRQGKDDDWALGDVDSQWGRPPSQRQQRRDRKTAKSGRRENRRLENAVSGDDDWSAFVTPDSSPKSSKSAASDDDAFFASLMDDLSDEASAKKQDTAKPKSKPKAKDDEDFFASLVDELSSDKKSDSQNSADDDFFAALEAEMGDAFSNDGGSSSSGSDDDFFAKLESEMKPSTSSGGKKDADSTPDFFDTLDSTLDAELNGSPSSAGDLSSDDFFSSLDSALDAELNDTPKSPPKNDKVTDTAVKDVATVKKSTSKKVSTSGATSDSGDLSKKTVPILKDMLRERGLKVSGKKSELIERLQQS